MGEHSTAAHAGAESCLAKGRLFLALANAAALVSAIVVLSRKAKYLYLMHMRQQALRMHHATRAAKRAYTGGKPL